MLKFIRSINSCYNSVVQLYIYFNSICLEFVRFWKGIWSTNGSYRHWKPSIQIFELFSINCLEILPFLKIKWSMNSFNNGIVLLLHISAGVCGNLVYFLMITSVMHNSNHRSIQFWYLLDATAYRIDVFVRNHHVRERSSVQWQLSIIRFSLIMVEQYCYNFNKLHGSWRIATVIVLFDCYIYLPLLIPNLYISVRLQASCILFNRECKIVTFDPY